MEDALRFLQKNIRAVVATSYRNLPYAATVYYFVDFDFNFYFATKRNTDKYFNLHANKNVAIVVGFGPRHIAVQARGHAVALEGTAREHALEKLMALQKSRNIKNWPIKRLKRLQVDGNQANQEVVIKVVPQHLVFMNLDDHAFPDSISPDFHQIIPPPKK